MTRTTPESAEVRFTCYCKPEPQGSSRGFIVNRANGKQGVAITSANTKLKPFRYCVTQSAIDAVTRNGKTLLEQFAPESRPVSLEIACYFQKPKSAKKRQHVTVKPDADKLARAVLDALTGILYADDSQVVELLVRKLYGSPERVEVVARSVDDVAQAMRGMGVR